MRKILFVMMMCVSLGVNAQRIDKPGEQYDCICEIALQFDGSTRLSTPIIGDVFISDTNKKAIHFSNLPEAIHYLTKRGWKYVCHGVGDFSATLKKEITNDDEILTNIDYIEDVSKKTKKGR